MRTTTACTVLGLVGGAVLVPWMALAQPGNPVTTRISTSAQRKEVSITVYNDGFGLVRETREVDAANGRVALEFRDVSSQIQPETVAIRPTGAGQLRVLEQNYRYDLLSPSKLLEKYVGRKVRVYRYNERRGTEDGFDADVLSVNEGQPVLRINGEITYDFPGRIAFPEVPQNLIAKPTLVWLLDSNAAKQGVEVTYLTRGLGWHSDYVLVVNDAGDSQGDLTGWVTLNNNTGAAFEDARLKLVAGNVQRVQEYQSVIALGAIAPAASAQAQPQFREEGFFEYHLYTLERPTTLLQNEQKQVTLLDASGIHLDKRLIFFGQQYWYRGQYGEVASNQKVGVYLDIQNKKENHLGMALPKGTVRVYKADKSGAKQFIGEDNIDHTPRDEKIRIKMGDAFDVVGTRKQLRWRALGGCVSETDWEISLRNHKDATQEVEDVEPIGGDWEILQESHPHTKKDSATFTYTVQIPARGEVKLTYRARVRWC